MQPQYYNQPAPPIYNPQPMYPSPPPQGVIVIQ